jgi:hypothetical protein
MDNKIALKDAIYLVPSRKLISSLRVGDLALNCYGRYAKVVEITCCKEDIKGKLFVCYYTENGEGSSISMSMKEDEFTPVQSWTPLKSSCWVNTWTNTIAGNRPAKNTTINL